MEVERCMTMKCNLCKKYDKCFNLEKESRCEKSRNMPKDFINQKNGKDVD